ncbi:MAG: ABC transporter permease [Deltaproteobacteria bacterium]|nr:ABC transporter permease [Deltaproteobacteria bacterium]MBN2674459.1 ABC transporter permease [Deltaproteobacteria bacterium]
MRELTKGFFAQLHVIHALILRETRSRFGKYNLGYIWAFVSPLSTIALFWGMFAIGKRAPHAGMDPIGFLSTGFLPYYIFTGCQAKAGAAVQSNKALLYYPQVHPLDLVAARAILETVTLTIVFFFLMLLNTIYTQHLPLESSLQTLSGLGLAALLGTSLGLVFCAIKIEFPTFDHLIGPLMRPLFWTSGLFFSVSEIPGWTRDLLLWNPVLHIVEFTRDGWFRNYDSPYHSYEYVLLWILGLGFVGLFLEKLTRRKI